MTPLKKTWFLLILFLLMFTLDSRIATASDAGDISFPGNGYVGVSLHTEMPVDLNWLIVGVTQCDINHNWVTATIGGVKGVIHSDGYGGGVHFLSWPSFLEICAAGSIRLFKPHKRAIGFAELEGLGIDLSYIHPAIRNFFAFSLGDFLIHIWIHKMYEYNGVGYDYFFMPSEDQIYCSELMAHGWTNTGASFDLFPSQEARTLAGWDVDAQLPDAPGMTFGMLFMSSGMAEDTAVYDISYIMRSPYFREVTLKD
ncbi:MAG: hypothetical protein HUN04_04710 [Desulfobacter sp.]|nr:MAG: hypothetical protein HUN04_04710 [Desulfobacter sp.]